jgi:hypothetical protein
VISNYKKYKHISFDLWLTLIKSNVNYKPKRDKLFREFFEIDCSLDRVSEIIRNYDLMCNNINETTGENFETNEIYLLILGSLGIDYKERGIVSSDQPKFLNNIFLAPLHAWIPRFIWNSKPINNLGLWYNNEVIGNSNYTSVAMGPVTYLYFAGGFIMVFLGFYFVGIIQKFLFLYFDPSTSISIAFAYLVLLGLLSSIDSAFNTLIISLFRDFPILLFFLFFIFKSRKNKQYNFAN